MNRRSFLSGLAAAGCVAASPLMAGYAPATAIADDGTFEF